MHLGAFLSRMHESFVSWKEFCQLERPIEKRGNSTGIAAFKTSSDFLKKVPHVKC